MHRQEAALPSRAILTAANARTALADLITYTQSPDAIEAYGFITGQIALAWKNNPAGMVTVFQEFPSWNVVPRLPDGEYLQASQMQIDVSNNSTVILSATDRDSLLSVVGTGTATLTGGNGIDLLFGGGGPTTLDAGAGNDYLFAGAGTTTFIDDKGNDYMKAGPGTDTFTFADIHPGHDTIVNFKVGTDILKIATNLDGIQVANAAQLISTASVVGGSTVFHFGPNHDVTIQEIATPSTLANSIVVF
jgi:Ca2+-binding RTX toxin-like protein